MGTTSLSELVIESPIMSKLKEDGVTVPLFDEEDGEETQPPYQAGASADVC